MSDNCRIPEVSEEQPVSQPLLIRIWRYVSKVSIGILHLRRVQMALTTIVVSLLILWFPDLEALQDDLLMLVAGILMVALGGYSVSDALHNGQPENERLEDLLEAVADELGVDVDTGEDGAEERDNAQT